MTLDTLKTLLKYSYFMTNKPLIYFFKFGGLKSFMQMTPGFAQAAPGEQSLLRPTLRCHRCSWINNRCCCSFPSKWSHSGGDFKAGQGS